MEDSSSAYFERVLQKVVPRGHSVVRGAKLLYRVPVNPDLTIDVDPKTLARGKNAFETDLAIVHTRSGVPRIVFEMKPGVTSHDVLVYAAKARQHKHVYPWLRYGLVAMRKASIPNRVFTHWEGLDFVLAPHGLRGRSLQEVVAKLLKNELRASRLLERVSQGDLKGKRLIRQVPKAS
jgi:hypothetical protein